MYIVLCHIYRLTESAFGVLELRRFPTGIIYYVVVTPGPLGAGQVWFSGRARLRLHGGTQAFSSIYMGGRFGAFLRGGLGHSWGILGRSWVGLGHSWVALGRIGVCPGDSCFVTLHVFLAPDRRKTFLRSTQESPRVP